MVRELMRRYPRISWIVDNISKLVPLQRGEWTVDNVIYIPLNAHLTIDESLIKSEPFTIVQPLNWPMFDATRPMFGSTPAHTVVMKV